RNLDVSHNTFRFSGLAFALIHNSALYPRRMSLRFESPAPEKLSGAQVVVVGGETREFGAGGTLTLDGMQPGENRWIAVRHQVPEGEAVPVNFLELDNNATPVNGFTVLAKPVPVGTAIAENVRSHAQAFDRVGAALGIREGRDEGAAARKLDVRD